MLVDENVLIRQGMLYMLERKDEFLVNCLVDTSKGLVHKYLESKPDVIIIDYEMMNACDLEPVFEIITKHSGAKILFLSKSYNETEMSRAVKAGAAGFLSRAATENEFFHAIKIIYKGEKYFRRWSGKELEHLAIKKSNSVINNFYEVLNKLTQREKDVLILLDKGLTSKQIAEDLKLGKRTIEIYRSRMIKKYNLNKTNGLMKLAFEVVNNLNKKK